MKKAIKVITIIFLSIIAIIACLFAAYAITTKDAVLDCNKLIGTGQYVLIYDNDGNEITSTSVGNQKKGVAIANLQTETIHAFIASEDRTFYKHNGLNYKRMLKALYKNVISGSFKEGASTISQQLIKNTHLSNDKTIKRKLNEIKLTRQLEKKYKKNEILEMYLNTIYFGHNCYGLQSAAEFYFNKKAEQLNLTESATIVGLLASPNNYSPFKNPGKSLNRRNIVLSNMLDCGYITKAEYREAIDTPLEAVKSVSEEKYGGYLNMLFDEFEDIGFDYYALSDGCTIKTYLDTETQNFIESLDYSCDNAVIVTDNVTGGVNAYKSTINDSKRQPGSTIKPILVYAPAIEEKNLSPFTKILDEKINFNGYSPENYDKKYHGLVTVTDCIKNSYNIPAVKTLNSLTIQRCEKYLSAMNITLDDDEKNLSIALGGMKYGLTIKELADCYSVFPNGGNYKPSRFIKEIISKEGKSLYKNVIFSKKIYSEGTCSLMNDMLLETTKSGTAKKLKEIDFDVASKTGTCGNSDGNTDAYAISYTSNNCIAVWLGDKENTRTEITGGNDCCMIMKSVLKNLYCKHTPLPLDTISGTVTVNLDREEYTLNNKIILADKASPKLNIMTAKVLKGNEPKQQSDRFINPSIKTPKISVYKNSVKIELCQTKYYSYLVKRTKNNQNETIYDGNWVQTITDNPDDGVYSYSVTPYYISGEKQYFGKEILLPSVNIQHNTEKPKIKIPDIANKDWYSQ